MNKTFILGIFFCSFVPVSANAVQENQKFSVERLRVALDRTGIQGAESGSVLDPFAWDAGMWLDFVDDPLVLLDQDTGKRIGTLVHRRMGGQLMGAIGILPRVQVGLEIPLILYQARAAKTPAVPDGQLDDLSKFGLGNLRIAPKIQILWLKETGIDLAIIPAFTVPTSGSSNYRGDAGVTFTPELAASRPFGPIRLAANLGYLLRKNQTVLNQKIDDEFLFRIGAAYRPPIAGNRVSPLQIDAMLSGGFAAATPFKNSNQTPLELLLQANLDLAPTPLLVFAGTGFGLSNGFGTPDWRLFFGTRFGFVDDDPDKDGIKGDKDQCPYVPEDFDGFEDVEGCADPDNDNDTIADVNDKCPNEPEDADEFEDRNGCPDPDNDQDEILDSADKCPINAEDKDDFEDVEGCPDPDNDQDGILDSDDKCPINAEDKDGFEDEEGCPDPDNDKDTLLDTEDRCPNEPGPVENAGCPDADRDGDTVVDRLDNCPDEPGDPKNKGCKARQLVTITANKIEILDKVYFKTGQAVIETRSYPLLDNVAAVVIAHPEVGRVQVEGHTDDRGNAEYNTTLSQDRANAVVKYLVDKGVPIDRLVGKGFGPTRPIDTNKNEKGRATNRRVEFNLLGKVEAVQDSQNAPTNEAVKP